MTIPIIDLPSPPTKDSATTLVNAAREHGFLYLSSATSGIPQTDIDRAFEVSRKLFSLPDEEKRKYMIGPNNRGYSGKETERLDENGQGDSKEAFNFGEFRDEESQPLPPALSSDLPFIRSFASQCDALCQRILRAFAIGLEVEDTPSLPGESFFTDKHDRSKGASGTILRLLHYPPGESSPGVVRAGAHSDYGSLTLLFRRGEEDSPGGLELQTPGGWEPVPVYPPGAGEVAPILVNLGDLLSYWTAGVLKSTVHRVTAGQGGGERYSIAYFCHPGNDSRLEPVPSKIVREKIKERGEEEREVITAKEHLTRRLAATYGWKKEE